MRTKVTNEGVIIPKEWLTGISEVDIRKQNGIIVVVPTCDQAVAETRLQLSQHQTWADVPKDDPIHDFGKNPVTLDVTDASENLDRYVYGGE
ncbi:MAG: hypothetical protein WAQ99_22530 [Pyrinomonadaceae bacterium]